MRQPTLHYEVHEGDGPYLLLVHGMLSSRAQWRPNLPALRQISRPVVVELLGHGRSPAPDDPRDYAPDRYVEQFELLRERLGVEQWFVCGQSLGAALTLRYASLHPDRLLAHVLTNSNSALADQAWVTTAAPAMAALAEALLAGDREALERLPIHPKNARRLPPDVKAELQADCALHALHGIAHTGRSTVLASSVRQAAAENRVRSLLLHGRHEKRFSENAAYAATAVPNLEIIEIEAGHAVNLEAPLAFDGYVTRFLTGTLGDDPTR